MLDQGSGQADHADNPVADQALHDRARPQAAGQGQRGAGHLPDPGDHHRGPTGAGLALARSDRDRAAGGYTYDWLERLAGLHVTSADRIIEGLKNLEVGDIIPLDNDGTGLRVMLLDPAHFLATRNDEGTWSWTWNLEQAQDRTRLVSRTRMTFTSLANRVGT
ncbi:MAG: hypothetical protein WCF12_08485, partial [Propionicimonas sp.]